MAPFDYDLPQAASAAWDDPAGVADLDARGGPGSWPDAKPSRGSFPILDADDIKRNDEPSLIKRLVPRQGLCLIGATSMSGKTFLALDIISNIAKGEPVLGRRTQRAGVVYIAAEGAGGIGKRIEGLRQKTGAWGGMLKVITAPLNLMNQDDVQALRAGLSAVAGELDSKGERLGALVIDTLAAATPGIDENSSKDMGQVLGALQSLASDFDICCFCVAHVGKDPLKGIRGWSGAFANADTVMMIDPPNDEKVRVATLTKVKDDEAGEQFAFTLDQVSLGTDSDGEEVNTCVVRFLDPPLAKQSAPKPKPAIQVDQDEILRVFDELVRVMPVKVPADLCVDNKQGVVLDELRARVFAAGFHSENKPEEGAGEDVVAKWADARRQAFGRAVKALLAARKLRRDGKLVWCP